MSKVGIFWVINKTLYPYMEEKCVEQLSEREKLNGKIDSDFSHFETWDKELAKKFTHADFATYPRGRVLFDIKDNRHIIYADKCIKSNEIAKIESFYQTVNAKICRDEHYRCDVCMKSQLPELEVLEYPDCYKVVLNTREELIQRTLPKDNDEITEFGLEDITYNIQTKLHKGYFSCKFLVEERPSSAFSEFFEKHSGLVPLYTVKNKIYYKILDGKNKIGANLIELCCSGKLYLIECGRELERTEKGTQLRKRLLRKHYDACFISHYHGDHAGLLSEPISCDNIYMGEATFAILQTINAICQENIEKVITFKSRTQIELEDMTVTPFLCDHSAYDSYMLYFKSKKNSILYTGDFRSNGRKNYSALLKLLPKNVDTLICEGTNIGAEKALLSEQDLENKLVEICNNDRPVFVLQSTTNIDRIVSVYRAGIRSNRSFIMRLVQADICSQLPNIPQPNTYKKCFTYSEISMNDEKYQYYSKKYGERLIGREYISKISRYILEVTSSDLHYLEKLSQSCDLKGSKLVYSIWSGYKENQSMKAFLEGVKNLGIEIVDLHAGGHASKEDIELLKKTVSAKKCVTVHTVLQKEVKSNERI